MFCMLPNSPADRTTTHLGCLMSAFLVHSTSFPSNFPGRKKWNVAYHKEWIRVLLVTAIHLVSPWFDQLRCWLGVKHQVCMYPLCYFLSATFTSESCGRFWRSWGVSRFRQINQCCELDRWSLLQMMHRSVKFGKAVFVTFCSRSLWISCQRARQSTPSQMT